MTTKTTDKIEVDAAGMEVLRTVLKRMRWDSQDGYPSYLGDGKWAFVSTGLPQVSPEELNTLFAFAGIVPDEIVPIGHCDTCKFGVLYGEGKGKAQERGYAQPCSPCGRPKMTNYVEYKGDDKVKCADCGMPERHASHVENTNYGRFHKFKPRD